jgi:hypothetical protein
MALPKIDVPIYETKLISNDKTIRYRPFLVKEQKLFLMAAESDDVADTISAIKQVIQNCVIDEIDVESMATFDIEHLFMQLRARSVGEIVQINYNCNNKIKDDEGEKVCGGKVKFDINVLDIKPLKDPTHTNKIVINDKMGMVMKYPTFKTVNKLDVNSNDMQQVLEIITGCIDFIYDDDKIYYSKDTTKEELIEFVENLTQTELEKIQNFFNTLPKFKKDLHFKCGKCNYEEDIVVEGIQNFFV